MGKIIVLLLIIAVLAVLVWQIRKPARKTGHVAVPSPGRRVTTKQGELEHLRRSGQFWGVEIQRAGCDAGRTLSGNEYTFENAPSLPLPDCSVPHCSCTYIGLKDHRISQRRVKERRTELRFDKKKSDRRSHKERRKSDQLWKDRD